jgi:hypothetical protein
MDVRTDEQRQNYIPLPIPSSGDNNNKLTNTNKQQETPRLEIAQTVDERSTSVKAKTWHAIIVET